MAWLTTLKANVYAYLAIIGAGVWAYIKHLNKKVKREKKRADNAEANEKLLIKTRKVEQAIDKQMADDEADAKLKELRNIKDMGDIRDDIKNITHTELIDRLNRVRDNRKMDNDTNT